MKKFFRKYLFYKLLRLFFHKLAYIYNIKIWKFVNAKYVNGEFITKSIKSPEPLNKDFSDSKIKESFNHACIYNQYEYLISCKGRFYIEPVNGWIITDFNKILIDSLPNSNKEIPKLNKNILTNKLIREEVMPSFNDYLKIRFFSSNSIINEKKVISLRDISEASYFHFYNDFLSKIILLERYNLIQNNPLVISKKLYEKKFFREILEISELKEKNWIIQDGKFVKAENVIFCEAMPYEKEYFLGILKLLRAPKPDINSKKRIFITRSENSGRNILNMNEIKKVCDYYDFEIVDTEKLSICKQIELFSKVRSVIAIHGAGIVNIIFRGLAPLSLLEIFPPYKQSIHYYWLASIFDHEYDAIIGENPESIEDIITESELSNKKPFYLNPFKFEQKIKDLIKNNFFL
jgi:hypothetical protein